MASKSASAVPLPLRRFANKARRKHHANNGGPNIHAPLRTLRDTLKVESDAEYNQLPSDTVTKKAPNGSFYRLGWSEYDEKNKTRSVT